MNPLLHQLVQLPGAVRPMGGGVNMPPQLPPILRFGGNERGPLQSQQFTGATVPHPLNLVSGGDIQPFTPPVYAPTGGQAPVHPIVAALAAALTGIHPPSPAPVGAPPAPPPVQQKLANPVGVSPSGAPLTAPLSPLQQKLASPVYAPGAAPGARPVAGSGLGAVIASLANQGARVGSQYQRYL